MRYTLWIVGVAFGLIVMLSLPPHSSHGLGTGANEWNTQSFGWPIEIWSRTMQTYRTIEISPEGREEQEIPYPTHYSIRWTQASMLLGGAIVALSLLVFLIRLARTRAANKSLHATAATPGD